MGDFGSAKINEDMEDSIDRGFTNEGNIPMHPGYIAPECLKTEKMAHNDLRLDVYTEGLIILDITTGVC